MKKRIVMIQVEVSTSAKVEQVEKYLTMFVRGHKVELVEKPKVNVIRETK